MRTIRYAIEYAGLRAMLALVDVLTVSAAQRLARAIAGLVFHLARGRRRTACENIRLSALASAPADVAQLAHRSFQHLGELFIEVLKAPRLIRPDNWEHYAVFTGPPATRDLLHQKGRGFILVSPHLGNWELGGEILSLIRPVTAIARPMNNPYTDRLIRGRNPRPDLTWIPKYDLDPRRLVRVLREGKVLVIMADQHARRAGIAVDFFGRPAMTVTTPAVLHRLTGAPIVFGYCCRVAPLRFEIRLSEPLVYPRTADRKADTRMITERLTREMENAIRAVPEQYLWAHRRWRRIDPAA